MDRHRTEQRFSPCFDCCRKVDAKEFRTTTLRCEDLEAMKVPREPQTGLLATRRKVSRICSPQLKRRRSSCASVLTGFDPPPNDDLIIQFGYVLEARLKKAKVESRAGLSS